MQQEFNFTGKEEIRLDNYLKMKLNDISRTKIQKLTGGILGGTITGGKFKVGQEIEISPGFKTENKGVSTWTPVKTKIKNMVAGNKSISEKGPGGSVAIETELDPAQTRTDSLVGNIIGGPGKTPEIINNLKIEPHLFDKVLGAKEDLPIEPIKMHEALVLNVGTATTWGMVNQIGNTTIINLKRAIAVNAGAKVAISRKFGSRWHLIGWGDVK